jgi:hypothetical protein
MAEKPPKSNPSKDSGAAAEARQRRSAEALRANLRRRKTQARDRADEQLPEPLPNPSPQAGRGSE